MGRHDQAFRALLAEPGTLAALLRERLPRALVRKFKGAPEPLGEHFVDESLRGSIADQVVRQRLRGGGAAYVYCLIEHKRTADELVLVQVLRYLAALYTRLARERRAGQPLPAVVTLVVYNGARRWRGGRRFHELLAVPSSLRRHVVDFEVLLLDLGAAPVNRLSAHPTLRGGLLALKSAAVAPRRQPALIRAAVHLLGRDRSTLNTFLSYLGGVAGKEGLPLVRRAMEAKDLEETMQTINQYLEMLGRRKGLRAGLKRGLERGREEGLRQSLRLVLTQRFKKVPATIEEKLAGADSVALARWMEAALRARSLRSVFSKPHAAARRSPSRVAS